MLVKKCHSPLPGQFGGGFVVAGRGVVVETVLRVRIDKTLCVFAGGF